MNKGAVTTGHAGPKEPRFLDALRDLFVGAKVAGQSGYINLMCIKAGSVLRMFKLDQYLDDPYIPYYNPKQNRVARFIPDFVFWGRRPNVCTIVFLDPTGMEQLDWERKGKLDGYRRLFEDSSGKLRSFSHGNVTVRVRLFLFTKDRNICPEGAYNRFWMDSVQTMFSAAFSTQT
jgi:hypothetical protein